jgi:glycosyltransferase involved in cell wall biosynthesis
MEIIIVDDGSTDNTREIVKGFSDPRIKYICQDRNRGVCAARNTGIRESRGEFIAFLDSDDEFLPEKIEKSVKAFKDSSPKVGFVASNFWRVIDGKKYVGSYKRALLLPWGVYARKVFEEIGVFDENFELCSDLDLSTRFVCSSFSSITIDEPLVVYYFTQGSLCTDFKMERSIEIKKTILKKCAPALAKGANPAARRQIARVNYFLGKDLLHLGRPREA